MIGLVQYTEAEKLETQVLGARNRILAVEHPETISAKANLAATYEHFRKSTEAKKLEMEVLKTSHKFLGVEHQGTDLHKRISQLKSRIMHLFHKNRTF